MCQMGQGTTPLSAIQMRIASARRAVTRKVSLTGAGNVPAATCRHSVDFEIELKASTCAWRIKPGGGSAGMGSAWEIWAGAF